MFNKNAQTAIEFVILVGFVLFFFSVFFLAIQGNLSDKLKEKQTLAVKSVALTMQDEINLAFQSTEGYYREFTIPENLNGIEYEVTIADDMVYVKTEDGKHAIALPVPIIEVDSVVKGLNVIRKEDGEVKLNVEV